MTVGTGQVWASRPRTKELIYSAAFYSWAWITKELIYSSSFYSWVWKTKVIIHPPPPFYSWVRNTRDNLCRQSAYNPLTIRKKKVNSVHTILLNSRTVQLCFRSYIHCLRSYQLSKSCCTVRHFNLLFSDEFLLLDAISFLNFFSPNLPQISLKISSFCEKYATRNSKNDLISCNHVGTFSSPASPMPNSCRFCRDCGEQNTVC